MKKTAIYLGLTLGSCLILSGVAGSVQANEKSSTPKQNQAVVLGDKQLKEDFNPEIASVKVDAQSSMLYCYLKTPIPKDYSAFLVWGENYSHLGNALTDSDGNTFGFSTYLTNIAMGQASPADIVQNIIIRILDNSTGKIKDYPIDSQDLKDVISNVAQLDEVNTLSSGDTTLSGKATPNTKVTISTYVDLEQEDVIAEGKTDENGNFNIPLSIPVAGYTSFTVSTVGQYNEKDSVYTVSQPKQLNENLFLNPTLANQAENWLTKGAEQVITNSSETEKATNFKALTVDSHIGAVQYKDISFGQGMKISMDVNVHSLHHSEYPPLIILGSVYPGGLETVGISKEFQITEKDLNQWVHLEYNIPKNYFNLPVGFTTFDILDMDVKNLQLTVLP